jgi:1-acyl-sn-glycerol-3-phosphate acyltransferase
MPEQKSSTGVYSVLHIAVKENIYNHKLCWTIGMMYSRSACRTRFPDYREILTHYQCCFLRGSYILYLCAYSEIKIKRTE